MDDAPVPPRTLAAGAFAARPDSVTFSDAYARMLEENRETAARITTTMANLSNNIDMEVSLSTAILRTMQAVKDGGRLATTRVNKALAGVVQVYKTIIEQKERMNDMERRVRNLEKRYASILRSLVEEISHEGSLPPAWWVRCASNALPTTDICRQCLRPLAPSDGPGACGIPMKSVTDALAAFHRS
jgi:hypothetical protein